MYPVLPLWLMPDLFICSVKTCVIPGTAGAFLATKPGPGPDLRTWWLLQPSREGREVRSQVTVEPRTLKKVTFMLEGLEGQAGVSQVKVWGAGRIKVKVRGLPEREKDIAKAWC